MQSVGVFVGGYGILPYPRHPLKFSHRIHRIHGSFWRKNILPRISQMLTDFYVAFLPPNLCTSVPICGRLSSPDGSMCSACSVGHSPHLLCWCSSCSGKRQSRAETVAPAWEYSPTDFTDFHRWLGCVIGSVGMAGCHTLLICAHPCLSVGGTSLPECSVCSACSVGTLSLFALLVLQRQLHQRGSILPRNSRISTDG